VVMHMDLLGLGFPWALPHRHGHGHNGPTTPVAAGPELVQWAIR